VKVGDKTARTPRPKASTVLVLIQFLSADRGLTGFDILVALDRRLSCGTVYPMLRRMERDGWITGEWVNGLRDRKRPYRLTRLGYREARTIMRQCATMRGGQWVIDAPIKAGAGRSEEKHCRGGARPSPCTTVLEDAAPPRNGCV
jgi:DNA-binding PadR family transcriptional regulator